MPIQHLSENDVHNITSGQVITELKNVVKELLENSVDANATSIQITFRKFGLDGIEVNDNGNGIQEEDFENLCLKNYTSKLKKFGDLTKVQSLGFRGEALNSICSIGKMVISTSVPDSAPKGWEVSFESSGVVSGKKVINQSRGTISNVTDIFHKLPVRRLNLEKNYKREFQHCINMLTSYMIILTKVRIIVNNIDLSGRKKMIMKTSGSQNIKDNIVNVFGSSGLSGLFDVNEEITLDESIEVGINGMISRVSIGDGRLTKDRQFVYINNRPVIYKRFTKLLNDIYKRFNSLQKPVFVLNITIDPTLIDINVTPDKGVVLISRKYEDLLINQLENVLEQLWDGGGTHAIPVDIHMSQNVLSQRNSGLRQLTLETFGFAEEPENNDNFDDEQEEEKDIVDDHDKDLVLDHTETLLPEANDIIEADFNDIEPHSLLCTSDRSISSPPYTPVDGFCVHDNPVLPEPNYANEIIQNRNQRESSPSSDVLLQLQDSLFVPEDLDDDLIMPILSTQKNTKHSYDDMTNVESHKVRVREEDLITKVFKKRCLKSGDDFTSVKSNDFTDRELSEKLLSLSIHKEDFKNLQIIGQFNKGFIIVHKRDTSDILIVDQHASDEKFNFENLIEKTTFESQPLVVSQKLDLNSIEKLVVSSNRKKFTKNGFKFETKPSNDIENEESCDFYLTTLPYSKNTIFNIEDLNELIQLVQDQGSSSASIPRPSKVRSMFAMRACRSSIMVGQALTKLKMEEVVQNLSTLDKPWNCPHGRPTMRHIVNIDQWGSFNSDYQL